MQFLDLTVHAIRLEADTILSFELRGPAGRPLPSFTAGAHVEVHMTQHMTRSYSLANSPAENHRYVIAVNKESAGTGGSRHMHEQVRVGQKLRVSEPRNNFELNEGAARTILVAGGIGITPMRAMIARLRELGRPWTLHYAGRTRAGMAYLRQMEGLAGEGDDVRLHVDEDSAGRFLDVADAVAQAPAQSHLYCCGPKPMLAAFEEAAARLPPERIHVEYFVAREEAATGGGFIVELARSQRKFSIAAGHSILDTLLDAGVEVDFSCMTGICGSCESRVLAGVPDHRDSILSKAEREANDRMLICCSGSKSPALVLDL
jgi:vanillate O-demethylase ferredoxin subunit